MEAALFVALFLLISLLCPTPRSHPMYFSVAQCVHVRLVGTGLGPVGDWGPDMQRAMGGGGGSVVCGVSSTVVLASSSKWRGVGGGGMVGCE